MIEFDALRRAEFAALDDQGVYLNTASIGPIPARSVRVLDECNRDRMRPATWPVERLNAILTRSRELCARLINATSREIALMPNTTTGLNVAARALPLRRGDVVLAFDRDFPAVMYPWIARAGDGIILERIPCTADGWPDEAKLHERLLDPVVRAVCVSLTQFSNGYTIDLEALSQATRAADKWLVVDAIQACGQVAVDVRATPVDFLACGAQKWLLSPWGTGFMYVREELIQRFTPTFAGWAAYTGSDDYSRLTGYDPEPWPDARRFEVLTFPVQDFAAMNASVELLLEIGIPRISAHLQALHAPLVVAATARGFAVTSPRDARGSGILTLAGRDASATSALHQRLQAGGVACSLREGSIRLSPHVFSTASDIERVAAFFHDASAASRG